MDGAHIITFFSHYLTLLCCLLVDFCDQHHLSSFGIPSGFHIDVLAMPGACLCDSPPIFEDILSCSRDMIFCYFGSFDLMAVPIPVMLLAWAFKAFLHIFRLYSVIFVISIDKLSVFLYSWPDISLRLSLLSY